MARHDIMPGLTVDDNDKGQVAAARMLNMIAYVRIGSSQRIGAGFQVLVRYSC
jgi:hypothetical protein